MSLAVTPKIDRVRVLMAAIGVTLDTWPSEAFGGDLTASEEASALASLLFELCVTEIAAGNELVAREMQRIAHRLLELADAPPEKIVALAAFLADEPGGSIGRQ